MGMLWSRDSLPVVPRQPQHVPTPAPTRSAGWKPGRDSGSFHRPQSSLPQLCCEQTLLQTQPRSLRAISKGLQTPAWFLLKQISTSLRHRPRAPALAKITSPQLLWARCHGTAALEHPGTGQGGQDSQTRMFPVVGALVEGQAHILHPHSNSCMDIKGSHTGKARQSRAMRCPCPAASVTSHLGQQVSLAGGTDERTVGYDTNPSFMPLHQAVLVPWHISQSAEGLPRVSRAALPQLWEEQPPQGASKQGANTDQQKGFV